jgi:tetratricopeptide (TPR) repeat protein
MFGIFPVRKSGKLSTGMGGRFHRNVQYLNKFDKVGINKYTDQYKQLIKDNPDNYEINMALGLCYLDLKLYDLSCKYFAKVIEQIPDFSDAYYYCALSNIKGKKIKLITMKETKYIEQLLHAALQLNPNRSVYYYLYAVIKYEYYLKNGLLIGSPSIEELLDLGNKNVYENVEVEKMLELSTIEDEEFISLLRKN